MTEGETSMTDFLNLIVAPLDDLLQGFKAFLPNLLAMVVILLLGTALASLIRLVMLKTLSAVRFDTLADRLSLTAVLRKIGLWSKPAGLLSAVVFWSLMTLTLMMGLSALQVAAIDAVVLQFFSYLPRILSAVLILVAGALLTSFASRSVLITAVNNGYPYARLLADAVRLLLLVLILAMAMEQLQIAPSIVLAAFSIAFGGIVVALTIAFGVGGIAAARRMIEKEKPVDDKNGIEHL
jgi:hypothetical protein